ncbi:Gfo/Idh/MocA family oxidoreductase [Vibrio fluvialis]
MNERVVKWAIAGLGNISHRFVKDLIELPKYSKLYAVASRDEQRAIDFRLKYGATRSYGSYLELAADPNVDVVYIATIHPFHADLAKIFLEHGKHVLVEKPAFTKLSDWDEMENIARAKGVLLLEAMKTMTFPAYRRMKDFIKANHIEITSIEASFGNWHQFDKNWHLFDPKLSGGATLDVGVYGLWLYADLCKISNQDLIKPLVICENDNVESKVDENVRFIFDGKIKGDICASITRNLSREAVISGPNLKIVIREKWWNPSLIDILHKGERFSISEDIDGGGFKYEIEHVNDLIINGLAKSEFLCAKTSREVISVMEDSLMDIDLLVLK